MASASAAAPRQRQRRRPAGSSGVRWDKLSRIALLGTLGVILLLYLSPAKHWWEASGTADDQRSQLQQLTKENDYLKHRVTTLRDPGALEREARRLGMVREGERSYVIEK
jgi:cell division protein FtsB